VVFELVDVIQHVAAERLAADIVAGADDIDIVIAVLRLAVLVIFPLFLQGDIFNPCT
jgi:hypothetical protein